MIVRSEPKTGHMIDLLPSVIFFELFNKNCLKHVIPSEYLVIDETYTMRNQISIKQYNLNKPAKYGLLFKSINDARFPW